MGSAERAMSPRSLFDRWRGWRGILGRSVLATAFGLALNIALLCYGVRFYDVDRQATILYTGNCRTVSAANSAAHVGVNVLATLLVSAASTTFNYLTAASRDDVDRLHARGESIQVGVWDVRNWKIMTTLRRALFLCAILSSAPLHLFYNSIFTITYVANDWAGFVVQDAFTTGAAWNASALNITLPGAVPVLAQLQQNATTGIMQRVEVDACKSILQPSLIMNYSAVLFVQSTTSQTRSADILPSVVLQHDSVGNVDSWLMSTPSQSSNFTTDHYNWLSLWNSTSEISLAHQHIATQLSAVEYCLLQAQPEGCSIQLVPQLIVPVIIFNILGALAGSVLFFKKSFEPLVTLGDAISSFLIRSCSYTCPNLLPDIYRSQTQSSTAEDEKSTPTNFAHRLRTLLSLTSSGSLQKKDASKLYDPYWYPSRIRWHSAVSQARWLWTSLFFTLYWLSGVISIIVVLSKSGNPAFALSQGLGGPLPSSGTSPSLITDYNNPVGNIILANVFQLILAANYLFYQNILARMAVAAEFSRFVSQRETLRVSNPIAAQRSGYFFSLPHRLALSLLAVNALLHFLVSEAIFYEQLRPQPSIPVQAGSPEDLKTTVIHAVICNPEALLIFEAVGLLAPAAAFAFGWLRRFDSSAPLVTGNSRIIAALSTHRSDVSGEDEVMEPLQWGVIEQKSDGDYVGFSSGAVQPLVAGKIIRLR